MYKLIINLKTYEEGCLKNAVKIAKIVLELESYAKKKGVEIVLCPNAFDIKEIVEMKVGCYSQHVDDYEFGAHTTWILPEIVKRIGAIGSLISHSEHKLKIGDIKSRIEMCRKHGLVSCVCARNLNVAGRVARLKPDMIAVEPKELIGGDVSVSSAKPKLIKDAYDTVKPVKLLVGAGIKNKDDVKKAVELGAIGVLVASGVVKAKNKKKVIKDLIDGFN